MYISAVNRLIVYLYHTKHLAIEYLGSKTAPIFHSSSDSVFADNQYTRKSSFGYLFQLYRGPID